ncbi:MAG: DEAD/DEAH box helicase [Oceanicaulis sp.]
MTLPDTIPSALRSALEAKGYASLTDVQSAVLAPEAEGRDLLVSAQTGSGKTVAFGLAMAPELLAGEDRLAPAGLPLALMIAPTRELALQVQRELAWLYAEAGARLASCVGGMDARAERRALERGAHIVVGTPGRLRDHIERGGLDLSAARAVVLDEADEMLDFGFKEDLEFILDAAPQSRRTLLFSATVSKPIARIAETYQRDALRLSTVSGEGQHADITYLAHVVAPNDRDHAVINVLRYHGASRALVFCATREAVNRLAARLGNRGFSTVALSGELSQAERTKALQALRDGRARVCVATDVAARGIDLPGLDLVVHAEPPTNAEALLHRSGRTGRAGAKGVSALIVPSNRRGRVIRLLREAKIEADWTDAPDAEAVRAKDHERLADHPALSGEIDETRRAEAQALLERFSAEQIAAAFLSELELRLPAPEELGAVPDKREPGDRFEKSDRFETSGRFDRGDRPAREPKPARAGFEPGEWFEINVGRKHRAEPRWVLPMICRIGDVTGGDIGQIEIGETATRFEIAGPAVARFEEAMGQPRDRDEKVRVSRAGDAPLQPASPNAPPARKKPARAPRPGKAERQAIKAERGEDALYEASDRPRKPRADKIEAPRKGKPSGKPAGKPAGKARSKPWPPEGAKALKRVKRKRD